MAVARPGRPSLTPRLWRFRPRAILPRQRDRNIGAAFLVGGLQIAIVHVLNTFLPDSCENPT